MKPWVELYRPTRLDDIVHHNEIVSLFKQTLVSNDFPNLLLYGPPGTGKTSSITALAKTMFGSKFEGRVLHLNASDERGIIVIRERVRKFAQSVPMSSDSESKKKTANLKLVILDEADSMTSSAQSCLRRTMEIYSKTTRFCLICNYVSRIIEPIASRCSKFRFQPISAHLMLERLEHICEEQQVKCADKVLEHLISVCDGDLRQAITTLQSAHRLAGKDESVDLELIREVSGFIPLRYIHRLTAVCRTKSFEQLEQFVTNLIYDGYTAGQFLSQLHDWLLQSPVSDAAMAEIIQAIALAEHRFCDGSDEYIQLMYVASVMMQHYDDKKPQSQ